jgi:hypothetical protein
MSATETASRIGPIARRVLENEYAQEQLRVGIANLQAAYRRSSKRGLRAADDRKVRAQVRRGAASVAEAARAFKSDRRKPKRRGGKIVLIVGGLTVAGAAAAVASSEELRAKLFGPPQRPGRESAKAQ